MPLSFQVLLFTATMPDTLQEAAAKWQRKPVMIHLAPGDMSISKTVSQVALASHWLSCGSDAIVLYSLLDKSCKGDIIM